MRESTLRLLKLDLADYIKKTEPETDLAEVIAFKERTKRSYGCSTCAFDYTVLDVTYIDSQGTQQEIELQMTLAGFIQSIED